MVDPALSRRVAAAMHKAASDLSAEDRRALALAVERAGQWSRLPVAWRERILAIETSDFTIIGERGLMYLLAAGTDDQERPLGRTYDRRQGILGPVALVGSILSHAPGWEEPDLPVWLEKQLLGEARALLVAPGDTAPPGAEA